MHPPDVTYAYQFPKDTSGPTIEIVHRGGNDEDQQAASTLLIGATLANLPTDKVFILSAACLVGTPGAGQVLNRLRGVGTRPDLTTFDVISARFNPVLPAATAGTFMWRGTVWIAGGGPGTTQFQLSANFDAGGVNNTFRSWFTGFVVPRANAALF